MSSWFGKLWVSILTAACLAGCAGTAPRPDFWQPISAEDKIKSADKVKAIVEAAPGVQVKEHERRRIAQLILAQIKGAADDLERPGRNYEIVVTLTRYDKGHVVARLMLAGLGQIHIEGRVMVYQLPTRRKIADFNASKTFAWGGVYGAATTIETIEETFAEIIASAVCE